MERDHNYRFDRHSKENKVAWLTSACLLIWQLREMDKLFERHTC